MNKDSKVSEGQKVGVRLNLNVMKNTGVPVQTMHDKTASGEALRYSPAVMVKNPELYVNQNAAATDSGQQQHSRWGKGPCSEILPQPC